jgi:hypothetical protein
VFPEIELAEFVHLESGSVGIAMSPFSSSLLVPRVIAPFVDQIVGIGGASSLYVPKKKKTPFPSSQKVSCLKIRLKMNDVKCFKIRMRYRNECILLCVVKKHVFFSVSAQ